MTANNELVKSVFRHLAHVHSTGITPKDEDKLAKSIPEELKGNFGVLDLVFATYSLAGNDDLSWPAIQHNSYRRITQNRTASETLLNQMVVAAWATDNNAHLNARTAFQRWGMSSDSRDRQKYQALRTLKENEYLRAHVKDNEAWILYAAHPLISLMLNPEIEADYKDRGSRRPQFSLTAAKALALQDTPDYLVPTKAQTTT